MSSRDLGVDRVQVYAATPPDTAATWAADMPPQQATYTIIRLTTRGGLEGVAGTASYTPYDVDRAVAETLRPFAREVLGKSASNPAVLWPRLRVVDLPVAPQAHSLLDIALWDLAAKAAGQPLYRLLGGTQQSIVAYGSTPLLPDLVAYLALVGELRAAGYRAIKFHCWCDPARDLPMVRAVRAEHPAEALRLMLDVEQRYDFDAAERVGRELTELDFDWFEGPLPDTDLEGYAALRRVVSIPILPAGNWVYDEYLVKVGVRMGAWSRLRFDATVCGGITPGLRLFEVAKAAGLAVELQSWGYTLGQAANLHLMLAGGRSSYFEQAVPAAGYEYACLDPLRVDHEGSVHAPEGSGLGVRMDWPEIERGAFLRYEVHA